jgi:hypothetical protein
MHADLTPLSFPGPAGRWPRESGRDFCDTAPFPSSKLEGTALSCWGEGGGGHRQRAIPQAHTAGLVMYVCMYECTCIVFDALLPDRLCFPCLPCSRYREEGQGKGSFQLLARPLPLVPVLLHVSDSLFPQWLARCSWSLWLAWLDGSLAPCCWDHAIAIYLHISIHVHVCMCVCVCACVAGGWVWIGRGEMEMG